MQARHGSVLETLRRVQEFLDANQQQLGAIVLRSRAQRLRRLAGERSGGDVGDADAPGGVDTGADLSGVGARHDQERAEGERHARGLVHGRVRRRGTVGADEHHAIAHSALAARAGRGDGGLAGLARSRRRARDLVRAVGGHLGMS